MSQTKPKKGFAWATLAKVAAARAGFHGTRSPLQGEAFSLEGEVSPCVQVFFQRVTFSKMAPFAFLGVYVDEFEWEWHERLLHTDLTPELEDPALALHVANVACLRPRPWVANSPSDNEVEAVLEWLGRVFEYAKRLPSSIDELVAAIEANKIADHDVEAHLGHPVKMRGFVQWLRRVHRIDLTERVLPLLCDRTEPYDVQLMLAEP